MSKSLTKITCLSAVVVALGSSCAFASDYSDNDAATIPVDAKMEFVTKVTTDLGNQALAAIAASGTQYLVDITSSLGKQALDMIEESNVSAKKKEIAAR